MSNGTKIDVLFPTGRMVGGDLYEAQTKDSDGRPLTIKRGPDIGKPTQKYWFAVAYAKTPGITHWGNESGWGQQIWFHGNSEFPGGQGQQPGFAWKITDGDSQTPSQPTAKNPTGTKPCDREGYPGNWVVNFSSTYAPTIHNKDGSAPITQRDAVKPGYFIQVAATVQGNGELSKPGIYINGNMVALQGYGPEIIFGRDPTGVGFGQGALPPGASAVPIGGFTPPVGAGQPIAAPGASAAPGLPPVRPPAPTYTPPAAAAPPPATAVRPSASFLGPNGGAPLPPAGPAAPPPPPVGPQMTAAATATYAAYRQAGWSDEQLRANGLMV
jgi:hypothetical protein